MRRVKVMTPAGKGHEVVEVAFRVGIDDVSLQQVEVHKPDRGPEIKDRIDVEVSTPTAKAFVEAVLAAPFFDPQSYTLTVRGARAIMAHEPLRTLTLPVVRPTTDILQDLWQFTHITASFITRVLIAATLLGYGMIRDNLLLMLAGLLFMPVLPLLLAIAFGLRTRDWNIAGRGAATFAAGMLLAVAGGAIAALLSSEPVHFQEFSTPLTSLLISLGVGIAAGVATGDDTGRQEMIGLAASAQTVLVPVWIGLALVRGFAETAQKTAPAERVLAFILSLVAIVVAAVITYIVLGMDRNVAAHPAERAASTAD